MKHDGYESVFRGIIEPEAGAVSFSKAVDKRVLGSMNDFVHNARYHLSAGDSLVGASLHMNEMPMSLIKMDSPWRAFKSMSAERRW